MCGIAGFIDFNKKTTVTQLRKMTDALIHRGPDGSGYEFIEEDHAVVGIGHRRLSIIDLTETGKQPLIYSDCMISFNGEVYNYKEIKAELIEKGHTFKGNSDTEVILHAYLEWGEQCLKKMIGMFAFVIFDRNKKELFCVRDRAGVKPFFYYIKDGLFLFASELKSFHHHPEFEKEINLDAVAAFMQYGNVPTPHCIFENTRKLKPGHFFKISLNDKITSLQDITEVQYWNVYDYYNAPLLDISYAEAKTELKKMFQSAFQYRMVSDVPLGMFLSGGFDSTCVTAMLQENNPQKLKTFTIGVPDIGLNEAPFAKEIAQRLGTEHFEFNCTEKEAMQLIPDLPYFYDEPFADSSAIPTMLVSKMAREEVTVALSADGGDEIFAGYNRYDYLLRYSEKLRKLPKAGRKLFLELMQRIPSDKIPVLRNKYNFHNRYEKLKSILANPSKESIMLSLSQQFTNEQVQKMFQKNVSVLETSFDSDELKRNSDLAYMMAIDYQTYLLDDILQKVDRATMSVSLEGREPFLDHRIIEFAAKLPDDYKYKDGIKKRILRDMVYEYIPKEMMDRPKMGFAIPIARWLQEDLRELVETYINQKRIEQQGIFNWDFISRIKNDFLLGKKELDYKIWYMLMFQMWYDEYISA